MKSFFDKHFTRREFLAGGSAGLMALGMTAKFSPFRLASMLGSEGEAFAADVALPADKRVGFAIVGLGKLALEQILPAFKDSKMCKPTALVSGDPAKARRVAERYGLNSKNIYNYENYDDLRNNAEVDVIYIVLPNSMHAEYTVRGARAGKHILCEKPMAVSVIEGHRMVEACKDAGKKLMIAYRIQYEPNNRAAMKLVRGRELGEVKLIRAMNGQVEKNNGQWRLKKSLAGGGSLPDIGLYCLNTSRFLTGEEPIEITADIHSDPNDPRFKEVEDVVNWTMRFPSGIVAACGSSYSVFQSRSYQVYGSEAWARLDPAFAYAGLNMQLGRSASSEDDPPLVSNSTFPQKNQFALEMDHMADCVLNNRVPFTPGEEGLQDQRLMEAIYASARDHKTIRLARVDKLDAFRGAQPSF